MHESVLYTTTTGATGYFSLMISYTIDRLTILRNGRSRDSNTNLKKLRAKHSILN